MKTLGTLSLLLALVACDGAASPDAGVDDAGEPMSDAGAPMCGHNEILECAQTVCDCSLADCEDRGIVFCCDCIPQAREGTCADCMP